MVAGVTPIWAKANDNYSEDDLSRRSIEEAACKERRLRAFYKEKGWLLAPMALDYLRMFKPEGSKRKDKITEDILHELDPLLMAKSHVKAKILPERVTVFGDGHKRHSVPLAFQSIEHLFIAIAVHDTDEDYPEASPNHFEKFMHEKIGALDISEEEKTSLKFSILFDLKSIEALTFGRKVFDKDGVTVKTIKTHDGDLNTYLMNLQDHWPAVTAKGMDRLGGLVTRFNPHTSKQFFSRDKQNDFLDETYSLFMHNQPLEYAIKRYPELRHSIDIINAKINVVYRCLSAFIFNHPEMHSGRKDFNPLTAKIIISEYLVHATHDSPYLDDDNRPMLRMLEGFMKEAEKHLVLMPLVLQMREQILEAIAQQEAKLIRTANATPGL